jgi:hypothetical protein
MGKDKLFMMWEANKEKPGTYFNKGLHKNVV